MLRDRGLLVHAPGAGADGRAGEPSRVALRDHRRPPRPARRGGAADRPGRRGDRPDGLDGSPVRAVRKQPDRSGRCPARARATQLLHRSEGSTLFGETKLLFTHALVQDVASPTRRADRAERHVRAAAWIERHAGARDDPAELLAHHYSTALASAGSWGRHGRACRSAGVAHTAAGRHADAVNSYAAAARDYAAAEALMTPTIPNGRRCSRHAQWCCFAPATRRRRPACGPGRRPRGRRGVVGGGGSPAPRRLEPGAPGVSTPPPGGGRGGSTPASGTGTAGAGRRRAGGAPDRGARYADAIAVADEASSKRGRTMTGRVWGCCSSAAAMRVCSGESSGVELMCQATEILAASGRYVAVVHRSLPGADDARGPGDGVAGVRAGAGVGGAVRESR